jgi:hypothetical protein
MWLRTDSPNRGLALFQLRLVFIMQVETRIKKPVQSERKLHGTTILVTSCRPCGQLDERANLTR